MKVNRTTAAKPSPKKPARSIRAWIDAIASRGQLGPTTELGWREFSPRH